MPDNNRRFGAYVRNFGDEYHWTKAQDNLASVTRFAGMPRTYGIQASGRY